MSVLILLRPAGEALPDGAMGVNVGNRGTVDLVVGTITIEPEDGTTAFEIAVDEASGATISPGSLRTVGITFTPATVGTHRATLRIPSSDPDGVTEVPLVGTRLPAPAPGIAVDPPSWAAGTVETTGGSATTTVTVTSTGTADLVVGTVAIAGSGFAKSADGATGQTIPPGESRTITLTFDPASDGAKTGSLTIPSDAGADVVVPLTGTGTSTPLPPPDPDPIPVSRFYLGRQAAPIALPAGHTAGWWKVTTDSPWAMTVAKGGPPTANGPAVDSARGEQSLHGTWISPPLAAQTINTTFTCMHPAAWRSSALGAYVTSALRFLVWRAADSGLTFGSVLAHASAIEPWVSTSETALPRRFPAGGPRNWETHAFTIAEGDRLVVQVGCRVTTGAPSGTAPTRIRFGGASSQADTPDSIYDAAPDSAGWLEFTDALLVLA